MRGMSYITTADAARRLNCTTATIKRLIASGHLKAVRLGDRGRWRIDESSVEAALRPARPS